MRCSLLALILTLAAGPAGAWSDSYVGRLELQALLQGLRVDLLSHDSATEVLTTWCADHRMADPPRIVVRRVKAEAPSLTAADRALLVVSPAEPVAYRHVQLVCGEHVLSEAGNWYVPARLTAAMNAALTTTNTPFGAIVRPLDFRRRTLESLLLFEPLPHGWETGAAIAYRRPARLPVPGEILRHRALLVLPDGTPFSLVDETYRSELLALAPPAR